MGARTIVRRLVRIRVPALDWPIDLGGSRFPGGAPVRDLRSYWEGPGADPDPDLLIADKAYDADKRVIEKLAASGKSVVIPPKANRRVAREYDREVYKTRHLIENFFAKIKQFRAIATRYEKTARNFLAGVYLTAAAIRLN